MNLFILTSWSFEFYFIAKNAIMSNRKKIEKTVEKCAINCIISQLFFAQYPTLIMKFVKSKKDRGNCTVLQYVVIIDDLSTSRQNAPKCMLVYNYGKKVWICETVFWSILDWFHCSVPGFPSWGLLVGTRTRSELEKKKKCNSASNQLSSFSK